MEGYLVLKELTWQTSLWDNQEFKGLRWEENSEQEAQ